MNIKGNIFDIERYAIHDGPGIRTIIFLKGCPLKCKWCANPESQNSNKDLFYFKNKCNNCKRCLNICPNNAISFNKEVVINRKRCESCGQCVELCYFNSKELIGQQVEVDELFNEVIKDKDHFLMTQGGITVSGGEPFMQSDFLKEVLKKFKSEGISTAIETCGYSLWENINKVVGDIDIVFYDVKHFDPIKHKEFTGVDNALILENLEKLANVHSNITVRIPFILGFNDEETVEDIVRFTSRFKNIVAVEVLPFHRLGTYKYYALDRKYEFKNIKPITKDNIKHLKNIGQKYNCTLRIGTI